MKPSESIEIYDVTPRDGDQAMDVNLSTDDKLRIARLDRDMGIPYVEVGFPESNPADRAVFASLYAEPLKGITHAAFGMTRKPGKVASEDASLLSLVASRAPAFTVVGKSSPRHIALTLRTTREENLRMIRDSLEFLRTHSDDVTYDAEHFFDAYLEDPDYALETLAAAREAGAKRLVLCDTNGGNVPEDVGRATESVRKAFDGTLIGIHPHNDWGFAQANMHAAVQAGARHIQGTWNGHGERSGNADLVSMIAFLSLRGYKTLDPDVLQTLAQVSRSMNRILQQPDDPRQPFVGKRTAAHKGGMHVSAQERTVETDARWSAYEAHDPTRFGMERTYVVSKQGGLSNIRAFLRQAHLLTPETKQRLLNDSTLQSRLNEKLKQLESEGYAFDRGPASLELLIERSLDGYHPTFQEVSPPRVSDTLGEKSVATLKIQLNGHGEKEHVVYDDGVGMVHALDGALRKALVKRYPVSEALALDDFHVQKAPRSNEGTDSIVQVHMDFSSGGHSWTTTAASRDMFMACWRALYDGYEYHLLACERRKTGSEA